MTIEQLQVGQAYYDGDRILVCTRRSLTNVARDALHVNLLSGYDNDSQPTYANVAIDSIRPIDDDPTTPSHPRPRFAFDSVAAIFRHWKITKRDFPNWRHIGPIAGSISGLPDSRGTLWVTNGILCIIEQAGDRFFEGHLQWFVPDTDDDEIELAKRLSAIRHEREDEAKPRKTSINVADYLNIG